MWEHGCIFHAKLEKFIVILSTGAGVLRVSGLLGKQLVRGSTLV